MKFSAMVGMFQPTELARLKKLGPALARRLELNDGELDEQVYQLAILPPDEAATWIRDHLDEIETRFAS